MQTVVRLIFQLARCGYILRVTHECTTPLFGNDELVLHEFLLVFVLFKVGAYTLLIRLLKTNNFLHFCDLRVSFVDFF